MKSPLAILEAIRNRLVLMTAILLPLFVVVIFVARVSPLILLLPLASGLSALYYGFLIKQRKAQ